MTGWKMSEHGIPESRITVICQAEDYVNPNGNHIAQWLCQCSCGSEPFISMGTHIRDGHTLSCGCVLSEITKKRCINRNKSELNGDYGILWIHNTNEEVYFDLCDADKILKHTWRLDAYGYPITEINGKTITMHSYLGYKMHDHINRNKKDNRSENLRPCTTQENSLNKNKRQGCSSSYIGVSKRENKTKTSWIARININKRMKYIGSYDTEQSALIARLKAEKEYYGDFAPQKNLFNQYGI